MTTRDELFQREEAIRRQLQLRPAASATPSTASAIPGMSRLTSEVVFGGLNIGMSPRTIQEIFIHCAIRWVPHYGKCATASQRGF